MEAAKKEKSDASRWSVTVDDFEVGNFLVRPLEGFVESPEGDRTRLEPKAIGVLTCLVGSQGRTVTKDSLFDRVWSDVEVTEHVLTRCISQLRRAFGDDGRKQSVIQTVYKRGYRLLLPVSYRVSSPPDGNPAVPEAFQEGLPESLGYRQILAATQDHIYIYDRDCRYLFVNPTGARAVGRKPESMIGKHWRELGLVAEILEPFEAQVHQCHASGKAFLERVSYPTVFGERRYEYSLDPVRGPGGEIIAVLAVVRDITDRCQQCPLRGDRAPE